MTRLIAGCGVAAALAGCGGPPPPPPPVLQLSLVAGTDQNPDTVDRPAPVAVHLFQLSDTGRFQAADVFALIEREQKTLGQDDLASEELVIAPGEHRTVTWRLRPGAEFLGVAVLFRNIDQAKWRGLGRLAPSGPSPLSLETRGIVATLSPPP